MFVFYKCTQPFLLVNKVVNGIKYHLDVELANAMSCLNDNEPSTVGSCPVDVSTVRHIVHRNYLIKTEIGEVMES